MVASWNECECRWVRARSYRGGSMVPIAPMAALDAIMLIKSRRSGGLRITFPAAIFFACTSDSQVALLLSNILLGRSRHLLLAFRAHISTLRSSDQVLPARPLAFANKFSPVPQSKVFLPITPPSSNNTIAIRTKDIRAPPTVHFDPRDCRLLHISVPEVLSSYGLRGLDHGRRHFGI